MTDEHQADKFTVRKPEDLHALHGWLRRRRYDERVEHVTRDAHVYELRNAGARVGTVIVYKPVHDHLKQIGVMFT